MGYEKHGTLWAQIIKDPIFQEQKRRSTNLRDRFRNAFSDLYNVAGSNPRPTSKIKMITDPIPPCTPRLTTRHPLLDCPGGTGRTRRKGFSRGGRRAFLRVRRIRVMRPREKKWTVISRNEHCHRTKVRGRGRTPVGGPELNELDASSLSCPSCRRRSLLFFSLPDGVLVALTRLFAFLPVILTCDLFGSWSVLFYIVLFHFYSRFRLLDNPRSAPHESD